MIIKMHATRTVDSKDVSVSGEVDIVPGVTQADREKLAADLAKTVNIVLAQAFEVRSP